VVELRIEVAQIGWAWSQGVVSLPGGGGIKDEEANFLQ